jgi:acetyl-CoA/propionyl-CoA carboxylase biotin carboxyl carrier protein
VGAAPTRILVANRGEIAVRVIRACRELGLACVAVHQPDERAALHVELADEAVEIGSFLDVPEVLAAARTAGADAVHPGYGYLAESAAFAESVLRAGLVWIGPPPAAMRLLADKVAARRLAEACGLPVTPGYAGVDLSDAALIAAAAGVGFPLLVKAAAGGGGRGMREVRSADDLEPALAAARREATAAFASDTVYLERRLDGARHVEVQVLADAYGRVVHLGERDCSLQRRHQKLLEESPSPAVDPHLRARLGAAAVELAAAAGYQGAGTVEFLLTADGGFCFLEMNARLQVEHPVTEAVTGVDLVRAQIAIAGGDPLLLDQDDLALRGHAIEVRLCAEDPAAGFLPATGRLERFRMPVWPGVRVDTGARPGDEVGLAHDPLLAKLIAHGEDRDACRERLAAALAEAEVLGVVTNLGFLRWLLDRPELARGEVDTGWVERTFSAADVPVLPDDVRRAALRLRAAADDPWQAFSSQPAVTAIVSDGRFVQHLGWQFELADDESDAASAVSGAFGDLTAPMPGTVARVDAEPGDMVEAGQTLVVLEAMKMELSVTALAQSRVTAVHVCAGDLVARHQTLVELEPA